MSNTAWTAEIFLLLDVRCNLDQCPGALIVQIRACTDQGNLAADPAVFCLRANLSFDHRTDRILLYICPTIFAP